MPRLFTLLIVLCALCVPAAIADDTPVLTVSGSGSVEVAPDELSVSFAVVSEEDTVDAAMADNSSRMDRVLSALRKEGLTDDQIATSGFSIHPRYNHHSQRNGKPPEIIGYTVNNSVVVRTAELESAGDLIEVGVDAGANRVSGLRFGLQNPQDHRAKAIAQATANARADAEALAIAAGVRLVSVREISLMPQYNNSPVLMERSAMSMDASGTPPIVAGDVSLSASVTIVYEIEPAH